MTGLYRRAKDYLNTQRNFRIVRPDEYETEEEEELQVSADERKKILAEIDQTMARDQVGISGDGGDLSSERNGAILPIVVNLLSVFLIAGGFFAALYYFDKKEEGIVSPRTSLISAEGQLLRTLQRETEQQLTQKNSEISDIQRQLAQIISERQNLQKNIETTLNSREQEIRADLARQTQEERARLADTGLSEEDLSRQLQEFEKNLRLSHDQDIAALRAQSEDELRQQETTLNALISEYETSLNSAELERTTLQQELESSQVALAGQLAEQQSLLTEERSQFQEEIALLESRQAQEKLVMDQVLAFYRQVQVDIQTGSFDGASQHLTDLRQYLSDPVLAGLPAMKERREVEVFLVGSLQQLISREISSQSVDASNLIESANLIASITALVEEANVLYSEGAFLEAQTRYLSAFSKIPSINSGFKRLQEIEARNTEAQFSLIEDFVAAGDRYYQAGNNQRAIFEYENALTILYQTDDGLAQRIQTAGARLQSGGNLRELEQIRADLENVRAADRSLIESQRQEIERLKELESTHLAELLAERDNTADLLAAAESRSRQFETELASLRRIESENSLLELENARLAAVETENSALLSDLEVSKSRITALESLESAAIVRSELIDSVDELKNGLLNIAAGEVAYTAQSSSVRQLETKLLIIKILNSDTVRSEYPDLQQRLNEYLLTLVRDERVESRRDMLKSVTEVLDDLTSSPTSATRSVATVASQSQASLMVEFLAKLELLLSR